MQSLETNSVAPQVVNPPTPENLTKKRDLRNLTLVLCGVIIIVLLIIIGILAFAAINANKNNVVTDTTITSAPVVLPVTSIKQTITILTPAKDESLTGKVMATGRATGNVGQLNLKLYDDNNNLLAQSKVDASGLAAVDWNSQLDVIASPETLTGRLTVTPDLADFAYLAQSVNINFTQQVDTANRVKILAPLKDQVMFSNDILFKGQMKGFFEGLMNIRLKDANGTIIHKDTITAGDNYDNFVNFSKIITVDNLSDAKGKTGTWEIYETSMKDGSETVLYSFSVRFI